MQNKQARGVTTGARIWGDGSVSESEQGAGRKVTLREVAEAAGVSISTASRALSGAAGISRAVRARVQSVAGELNYAGAAGGALTITIISNLNMMESGAGEFVQSLMRGIEGEALRQGIPLSLSLLGPGRAVAIDRDAPPAGVLLLSLQDEAVIARLRELDLPSVIVNGREPLMQLDTVAPANRTGGHLAARHLIGLGHRRVLMLSCSSRPTIRDRVAGYSNAMSAAGIDTDGLIIDLPAMRTDVAYTAVKARLEQPGGRDFTAIQCCNDTSAFGAMTAVLDTGLRIPQDVSIVGFDDIPAAAMNSCPLTTIRVDSDELGASGVRRLIERIKTPGAPRDYTEYEVELVVRDSSGMAAQP